MTQHTTRILPQYNAAERPAWLVHSANEALHAALSTDEAIGWAEFAVRACDAMATAADGIPGFPGPGSDRRPACQTRAGGIPPLARGAAARQRYGGDAAVDTRAPADRLEIAMAAELLGGIATRAVSPYDAGELCRKAYSRCWDSALNDLAASPQAADAADPVLYDHGISLRSLIDSDEPWPCGVYEALGAVKEFAHQASAASSLGLCLAHVAPGPVAWPPPPASPPLDHARKHLDDALARMLIGQQEHTAMLHSYLSARDNPDVCDPSPAEADQVQASVRDWYASVVPAAVGLAAATFAHAYEWVSIDTDRWDPGAIGYAHTEAYLSIYHLRQVTDAYDLTNGAVCSYAWWWCHDRRLDLDGLRSLACTW